MIKHLTTEFNKYIPYPHTNSLSFRWKGEPFFFWGEKRDVYLSLQKRSKIIGVEPWAIFFEKKNLFFSLRERDERVQSKSISFPFSLCVWHTLYVQCNYLLHSWTGAMGSGCRTCKREKIYMYDVDMAIYVFAWEVPWTIIARKTLKYLPPFLHHLTAFYCPIIWQQEWIVLCDL